ncbi:hypothetical protein LTR78_001569 [Recurvomyces mirabilis]|uniref:Mob1/phocein n=1 Tax=Recurvomyces mirabilis TaxID=574656 RepID=A0AAE1C518_9PEZI|nr:hypothetical protein LTR78_001569 [Recurvomyces mirabilis]KAK5151858.1 hypothetical protein LTS14_008992 [Recurvomyces mirabilis]
MAAAHSPASSPRLPSPPPIAEDQLGPASPGLSLFEEHGKLPSNAIDTGASRRIRPGTKAEDMAEGPPLVELHEIDSAFQLTEHLKALHYNHTHPPNTTTTNPIVPEIAKQLAQPPPNTSREIWLYELGRFLIQKTNSIIVALFADDPPCSPQTCSEMRASEWQYLCAVHDPPKSCAAIDYCCHTLDWAATTLTSSKMFPSRLGLGSGAAGLGAGPQNADKVLQHQIKELTNIFRRVYRIYAHAWFQHREMFWRVEGKTGLYVLFKTVCDEYGLIQAENYTIPPEAEGLEPAELVVEERSQLPTSVLERPGKNEEVQDSVTEENRVLAVGNTIQRHTRTKSNLTDSAASIKEEDEEPETEIDQRKPDLGRQAKEMKAIAESLPQPGQKVEKAEDSFEKEPAETAEGGTKDSEDEVEGEPNLGIQRSDTIKPHHKEAASEQTEESEDVETTVVEVEPDEAEDGAKEPAIVEVEGEAKVEVMEPEAPAKEPEEAGKSVAD